jgi:Ca2+-binding EF-hand superfamily protein
VQQLAAAAGGAAGVSLPVGLVRLRNALRDQCALARKAFALLDADGDGCLALGEAAALARRWACHPTRRAAPRLAAGVAAASDGLFHLQLTH